MKGNTKEILFKTTVKNTIYPQMRITPEAADEIASQK